MTGSAKADCLRVGRQTGLWRFVYSQSLPKLRELPYAGFEAVFGLRAVFWGDETCFRSIRAVFEAFSDLETCF